MGSFFGKADQTYNIVGWEKIFYGMCFHHWQGDINACRILRAPDEVGLHIYYHELVVDRVDHLPVINSMVALAE